METADQTIMTMTVFDKQFLPVFDEFFQNGYCEDKSDEEIAEIMVERLPGIVADDVREATRESLAEARRVWS